MKKFLGSFSVFLLGVGMAGVAQASSLKIEDARIFAPLKGTNATAGYAVLTNTTTKTVVVKIDHVDSFKASELHKTIMTEGRMKMEKMEQVNIEPGKSFELKPGGNHIMLFDPLKEIKANDHLKVFFSIDGKIEDYTFKVQAR